MLKSDLTLSSIYTHFNTLKKKTLEEIIVVKDEIANFEQFHIFPQCTMFSMESVILHPLIATFQLSSAVSLNLRRYQNGV